MRRRWTVLFVAMMVAVLGAQASVTIDVNNNTDGSNRVWTVTDLNGNPPSVSGDNAPAISGTFTAIGGIATDAEIGLNFSAAINYDSTMASNAIVAGTFGSYIDGLTSGLINAVTTAFGINSGTGDSDNTRISDNEALIIELSTTNLTSIMKLESFGWVNETVGDRADILIYHAASNTVTEIQWNKRPSNMSGSWEIQDGDIMVVGNRAEVYRWNKISFDIESASAVTNVSQVQSLAAEGDDGEVRLDWLADTSGFLDYYKVYRSTTTGTNYAEIATGITTNAYADTNVVNDTTYYYVVSAVGTNGWEAEYSSEVAATPSAALTIINLVNNQQGDTRATNNLATATYMTNGTKVVIGAMKAGEYGNKTNSVFELGRPIIKFPLALADLGDKTTNDIDKVLLRVYPNQIVLADDIQVEVYASQAEAANAAIVPSDFENPAYSRIGTWSDITTNSPANMWYDFDVTAAVLADLSADVQDAAAGSCFRLQLTGDTDLISTNNPFGGLVSFRIDDNSAAGFEPQLRIEFKSNLSGYEDWVVSYGGGLAPDVDTDNDGLDNLYEYGLDGNPTNGTTEPAVLPVFGNTGSGLEYIHVVRNDDTNLTYTVLTTDNLVIPSWTNTGYTAGSPAAGTGVLDTVTNTIDTTSGQLFIKLIIEN